MSKTSFFRIAAAGAVTAAFAFGAAACGPADDSAASATSGKDKGATTAATAAAPTTTKKAAPPAAKPAFKGNGTFQVGTDIQPGTYKSSGNDDGLCYWERSKDAKGEVDSVLSNDNVTGSSYVTIAKTDKFFKSTDCADWFAAASVKGGAPKTTMSGNGMYKVGGDIQPGTYRSTGNKDDGCYWERDKDALHGLESVIANDNVSGTAIVTVAKTDAYFKTAGCGDWTKTG